MSEAARPGRTYSVFGLHVRSSLPLPELPVSAGEGAADVIVEEGKIDFPDTGPGVLAVDGGLLLTIPDVARFLIAGGRSIRVEPHRGVDRRNVRLFLLGSAFGALLHQRGLLPLHANAVEIDGRAFAFVGASGEGKSTLAAWFHDRGHRLLADDVCVLRFDEQGRVIVCPGVARLRLWRDVIERTGRDAAQFDLSYAGDQTYQKYDVPLESGPTGGGAAELGAVYLLARGAGFAIQRLDGVAAVEAISANTYRGQFIEAISGQKNHWESCIRLVRSVPVFRVERTRSLGEMDDENSKVVAHAEAILHRL